MRRTLLLGTTLGVGAQLASLGLLLTSAWLIVRAAEQPPVLYLIVAVTSVRMFGIARAVLRYGERLLTHDVALARTIEARVHAYRELDRVAPGGLAGRRHGDVVRTVVTDVDSVQDRLLRIRLPWVVALAASSTVVLVVWLLLPAAGLVLALHVAVVLVVLRLLVPRLARRQADAGAGAGGELAAEVTELVRCAPDLLALGVARERAADAHAAVERLGRSDRRHAWVGGLGSALVLVASALAAVALALLTAGSTLDAVLVGVVVLAPVGLAEVLETVAEAERLRPRVEAAERRLRALADLPSAVREPAVPGPEPQGDTLVLEGLAVGWGWTVAAGLDLVLPAGGAVAVVGPSGSGKSTLAATLLRLVEPRGGRVLLGGVDLTTVPAARVRERIGWLAQDETVLDTTIRENLRVGDPAADDAALLRVLRRAGLESFVTTLPRGLDTPLGEGGRTLSGGERQRLGVARMLLAGHRVLVLDEPTEHLDAPTARALLDDLATLCPEHSLVLITHDPAVMARFPNHLVLGADAPLQAVR